MRNEKEDLLVKEMDKYKRVRTIEDAKGFLKEYPNGIYSDKIRQKKYYLLVSSIKESNLTPGSLDYVEASYKYDSYGLKTFSHKVFKDSNGNKKEETTVKCKWDEQSNLILFHYICIDANGEIKWDSESTYTRQYNKDGLKISETEIEVRNDERKEITTTYKYDLNDNLLAETEGKQTTKYEYDRKGNLILETGDNGKIQYKYDQQNKLIQKEYDDQIINCSFILNSEGHVSSETCVSSKGVTTRYNYDDHGNLILKTYDGNHSSKTNFNYELRKVSFIE